MTEDGPCVNEKHSPIAITVTVTLFLDLYKCLHVLLLQVQMAYVLTPS